MLFRRNPMKFFFIIINIDVMYCPKDIFLMATSRVTIFQVVTSQMCNFPIATSQRLGYALAGCNGGRALLLVQTWEVATWENTLGKLPLSIYLST